MVSPKPAVSPNLVVSPNPVVTLTLNHRLIAVIPPG